MKAPGLIYIADEVDESSHLQTVFIFQEISMPASDLLINQLILIGFWISIFDKFFPSVPHG